MKEIIKRIRLKWLVAWLVLVLFIGLIAFFTIFLKGDPFLPNILQTFGVITSIYAGVLIFLATKIESEKSLQKHLVHLQHLNKEEIEAMQLLFQQQIDAINTSANTQIAEFKNTTNNQITAIHETTKAQIDEQRKLTDQQISALNFATQNQIENYRKQTSEIVTRLEDNSILLAEILLRQLEEKLGELNNMLSTANAKYESLQEWTPFRPPAKKAEQIARQKGFINRIEQAVSYIKNKCQQIKDFLNAKG